MSEDTRDIAVEARTLSREAHSRIGGLDEAVIAIRADVSALRESVAKLKTQAGFYAGAGAFVASAAVGIALHFWH